MKLILGLGGMRVPRLLLGGMEGEESQVEGEDGGTTERTERLDASNHQVQGYLAHKIMSAK